MDTSLLIIFISAVFVNNFVLTRFLGICPFIGISTQLEAAIGMSGAVTFVLVLASAITSLVENYILKPLSIQYLQTVFYILIIAFLVQLLELLLRKFSPSLQRMLGVYLPLITTNCIILAVPLLNAGFNYSLLQAVIHGLGAGCGFAVAIIVMAGIRERLETADIPLYFRGLPITFITASLMSMAFLGFSGLRI
jgi:electron transport complex protein RnfA